MNLETDYKVILVSENLESSNATENKLMSNLDSDAFTCEVGSFWASK
jgi:hypothetical protein